jgi:glucokinase
MAFVGIDVGGTRIKLGLVKQKKMVSSSVFEVKNNHSLEANLPLIIDEIKALSFAFDASEPIEGIGMALPCLIDHKKNKILSDYVKYPDAKYMNLEGWFNTFYKVPFIIENDARAALVGEIEGIEHGTKDAVLVTFGTGIGTAVLSNGAMLRGFNQFAGNLGGHQTIHILGDKCNCGDIGCAEALASGWALHSILETEQSYEMSKIGRAHV